MLDDMRPILTSKKVNDLFGRLNDKKRPEQIIGAEMELGLLWGIKQVAQLQVDPVIPNSSRVPEARSEDLFNVPSYIEVTTISDGKLSGEEHMQRAAQKLVEFANKCRKKCGKYLYFSFGERSFWEGNKYFRLHHVAPDFALTDFMKCEICDWINSPGYENVPLRLRDETISVTIEFREYPQKSGFNFFSSLPPLAYDIEDNPLFAALESKYEQLSGIDSSQMKVILIADGGSSIVRRFSERDPQRLFKSGAEIVDHFLGKRDIDLICVFSPFRNQSHGHASQTAHWKATYVEGPRKRISSYDNFQKLVHAMPVPRFEGYQARVIQKQSGFSPTARGWYLGTKIGSGKEKMTVKMSARLLHEFLAGRITADRFHDNAIGKNLFENWLNSGYTISDARFESAGIDEDDDNVVFEFRRDPAAADFI
jgi:hypothetical protein